MTISFQEYRVGWQSIEERRLSIVIWKVASTVSNSDIKLGNVYGLSYKVNLVLRRYSSTKYIILFHNLAFSSDISLASIMQAAYLFIHE